MLKVVEMNRLSQKTIILGVTGGIAAYKAAEICSSLVKTGAEVHVVMTEGATHFVGPATFRALTGNPVIIGLWDEPAKHEITHVALPDRADAFLIAPATANILGKIAWGIADDMLSTMVMATTAPVILAPAMNRKMWENPVVNENVRRLESLGYILLNPEAGRLACGEEGVGRLADVSVILQAVEDVLQRQQDLAGISILVTAGPTQEPIDPVRFIANRSSGKMGYAIAKAAADRGARVILVTGPTSIAAPANVEAVHVRTATEMLDAVLGRLSDVDAVIGAAAVADFTPKSPSKGKIKKSEVARTVELEPTKDILAEIGRMKKRPLLVAFAAETEALIENAKAKLKSKNADLVVANDVSRSDIGFGSDANEVAIISKEGNVEELPAMPKSAVGHRILDLVNKALNQETEE